MSIAKTVAWVVDDDTTRYLRELLMEECGRDGGARDLVKELDDLRLRAGWERE